MPKRAMTRRTARRAVAVLALAVVALVAFASPAWAHAVLVSSTPNAAQILETTPDEIRLEFSEAVEANLGSVRLYDEDGARLGLTAVSTGPDDVVHATVPEQLGDGSYVVTWRVISADSHPVRGAFTFQVGTASDATSPQLEDLARRLTDEQAGDRLVGVLLGIGRWGVFAGIAALVGGLAFVSFVDRAARGARWARRLVWGGWGVCLGATAVGLLLLGPYGAGVGLGEAFDTSLLGDVLSSRYGLAWLARVVVLLAAIPLVRALLATGDGTRPRAQRVVPALGIGLAVVLAVTVALAGHATTGDYVPAAFAADVLHVGAMAVWVGGLAMLTFVALASGDVERLEVVLPRWSRVALCSVAVVVVTGTFQGWRQVGSLDALRDTEYGRLLIIKVLLVAIMLLLAFRARRTVWLLHWWWNERKERASSAAPPRADEPLVVQGGADDAPDGDAEADQMDEADDFEVDDRRELRVLRRGVAVEVLLSVLVLVVTALLVNSVPAKTATGLTAEGATGVTLQSADLWIEVDAAPARAGANDIHAYTLSPEGSPVPVEELSVTFELPRLRIAPIEVPLRMLTSFHGYSPGFDIPIAGDWHVTARARLNEFDETTLEGTIEIR